MEVFQDPHNVEGISPEKYGHLHGLCITFETHEINGCFIEQHGGWILPEFPGEIPALDDIQSVEIHKIEIESDYAVLVALILYFRKQKEFKARDLIKLNISKQMWIKQAIAVIVIGI